MELWPNPNDWKQGLVIKLPKNGDLTECRNWRGITLLNTIGKILATIIYSRLKEELEPKMRPEQAGFRSNKACADHMNIPRIIVEQSVEFRSPLQLVFINFQQDFDTLAHNAIWQALEEKGVPQKIISVIKAIYDQSTSNVLHKNLLSETIPVLNGVKQGCTLSPLLFNVILDYVMSKVDKNSEGIILGLWGKLTDLKYADDICLLTH
jgi:sorting nexin-29